MYDGIQMVVNRLVFTLINENTVTLMHVFKFSNRNTKTAFIDIIKFLAVTAL